MCAGSSPRGRGKPRQDRRAHQRRRLIPARAGKTRRVWRGHQGTTAHPRAGGENFKCRDEIRDSTGSSPRGRGKLGSDSMSMVGNRLIPARAGKTGSKRDAGCWSRAHPRAGGENHGRARMTPRWTGSSPRGRGKPDRESPPHSARRLIPARAGKTVPDSFEFSREAAHPRAGGENAMTPRVRSRLAGSSPRGRGKRGMTGATSLSPGLIPARAGKTDRRCEPARQGWAHPRAGGENTARASTLVRMIGSSPRGRGKRKCFLHVLGVRGLIPARAGKT